MSSETKRTAIPAAGYQYQTMQGLKVLSEWQVNQRLDMLTYDEPEESSKGAPALQTTGVRAHRQA